MSIAPSSPNIVWMLVDSVRAYRTDADVRGKLPVFERFGSQSVEFATCVTTAPSTIMSITAMMTGLPSYFLARNYRDFRFDAGRYACLTQLLKQRGYTCHAFLRGAETRLKFKNLLDAVPKRYWPSHLGSASKWRNEDLNAVLECVLKEGVPQPAFLFFHYNPQTSREDGELLVDAEVSARVEEALERLNEAGFTRDNTIFVLCSDHGFPDPSTGLTTEWEVKHRLTHDLVLTDDNILIPLCISYPGCTPRRISTPVSSLDLFPTLAELTGVGNGSDLSEGIDGTSLVPLMETADPAAYSRKFFRCDARLMLQTGRATAIRSAQWKYIRYHDAYRIPMGDSPTSEGEVLIDLVADPGERVNVLRGAAPTGDTAAVLSAFREEMDRGERRALALQVDYMLARQHARLAKRFGSGKGANAPRVLLLFEPGTAAFSSIGIEAVRRAFPSATIEVAVGEEDQVELERGVAAVHRFRVEGDRLSFGDGSLTSRGNRTDTGLTLIFVQEPSMQVARRLIRAARSLPGRSKIVVDCNFNSYNAQGLFLYRIRTALERVPEIIREPRLALPSFKAGVGLIRRTVQRKFGRHEGWREVDGHE